jgi:hypothetical protein
MEKCLHEVVQQARREEHLNSKAFASLLEAQAMAAGCQPNYNEARPHSSLKYLAMNQTSAST